MGVVGHLASVFDRSRVVADPNILPKNAVVLDRTVDLGVLGDTKSLAGVLEFALGLWVNDDSPPPINSLLSFTRDLIFGKGGGGSCTRSFFTK